MKATNNGDFLVNLINDAKLHYKRYLLRKSLIRMVINRRKKELDRLILGDFVLEATAPDLEYYHIGGEIIITYEGLEIIRIRKKQ